MKNFKFIFSAIMFAMTFLCTNAGAQKIDPLAVTDSIIVDTTDELSVVISAGLRAVGVDGAVEKLFLWPQFAVKYTHPFMGAYFVTQADGRPPKVYLVGLVSKKIERILTLL